MNTQSIPDHIRQWAADHWDAHLDTEEIDMVALAFMAGQAAAAAPGEKQFQPGGMTRRQSEAYAFIRCFNDQQGYSPSFQQIATAVGLSSKSRVSDIVVQLERRGWLQRLPRRSRSLSINLTARA